MDIANITVIGRLTRDPEVTKTENNAVTKFALAVNGFKKDEVSFFDCEAWGAVGVNIANYCTKGKQIAVAGTARQDRWKDKDGNSKSKFLVNVKDLTLLASPKGETTPKVEGETNEIPF